MDRLLQMMRRIRIQTRLWILLGVVLVALPLLTISMLAQFYFSMKSMKVNNTQFMVETAYSLVEHYHRLQTDGELSEEQAQAQAMAAVAGLRYGEDNYYWIQNREPRMLMHPFSAKLVGTNLASFTDPTGKHLFREAADVVARHGEGTVFYMWPLPGEEKPTEKVSYVKEFAPWGWIIGSGVYMVDVNQAFRSAIILPLLISVFVVALVCVLTVLLGRSIVRPLVKTSEAMDDIATGEGDLTLRLEVDDDCHDELATMSHSFNLFVAKIEDIIIRVTGATAQLTAAVAELRHNAEENAAAVNEQTQESHTIASAVTQMSYAAAEIARNSEGAAASASQANGEADHGKEVVSAAMDSINTLAREIRSTAEVINQLNASSESISSVLDVIREVAEQTNLLALNATIEAARAGEHGRGFVVVADEVRTLAAETRAATEEIRLKIEALQGSSAQVVKAMSAGEVAVEDSVSRSSQASMSLEQIVGAINSITEMNVQIASAAEEQSAVAQDIDRGVVRISELISRSSTEIERTSVFTRDLEELSQSLSGLVTQFKVREEQPA
ncbi:methyl-accepting chemotaxis protein [Mangrovimicrobium sediminis]|uniref:Methyl-accepting chemotaxis protein n=1 Tax=Mangrovimicrobium sediminis TaxID=2562682 RepID=A0A4Z0M518_9GAMM|nr:methyl-accepting chemotaxis protein [Haliea sp. SAOS-164]TGD74742.1 methyl-accepting chemotaxis protein [Haliea sp. SAOS-164]